MILIPPLLLQHLQQPVTTTCRLLQINLRDGRQFGITTLDKDIVYLGVTYSASNGFDQSVISSGTGLKIDNSEATSLLSTTVDGITYEMAKSGDLDEAQWVLYLVNWADLSMGHATLGAGDIGQVNTIDGMIYIPELVSYISRLKQGIGGVWSLLCRADFGTEPNDQRGCGVDVSGLWVNGTVTAIGTEPNRVFAASALGVLSPNPVPGRVQWLTGPNASPRLYQVEAYSSVSGTVALFEPTPFPIAATHTFKIRVDCNKTPANCIANANLINYKGEPFIPVEDGLETMTPNAQIFGGISGSNIAE